MADDTRPVGKRPLCKYGRDCYRKNPSHFKEYSHPDVPQDQSSDDVIIISDESPPAKKHKNEPPLIDLSIDIVRYPPLFYLTKVRGIPDIHNTHNTAIGIRGTHI